MDATNAGVAFTLAYIQNPTVPLHLAAGESYQEERMVPNAIVTLRVGAAVAARAELVIWEA